MQLYFVPASLKLHRRHMGCGGSGSVAPSFLQCCFSRMLDIAQEDKRSQLMTCLGTLIASVLIVPLCIWCGHCPLDSSVQGEQEVPEKRSENWISQQQMNENGIRLFVPGAFLESWIFFRGTSCFPNIVHQSVSDRRGREHNHNHDQEAGKRKKLLCDQLLWWHMIWMVLNCVLFVLETLSISRQVSAASEQKVCKHGWPPVRAGGKQCWSLLSCSALFVGRQSKWLRNWLSNTTKVRKGSRSKDLEMQTLNGFLVKFARH